MKDGISEWAALAEEAEREKKWQEATTLWQEACSDSIGFDIRDSYITKRNECDRKACKTEQAEWKPEADQKWLGVESKED